jgi:hypothetical protein
MENAVTQSDSILFYRNFSNEFANRSAGRYIPVPRVDVEKLFQIEEGFQLDRLSSRAKTAEVERVLNGTQILTGIIGRRGNSIAITISLYSFPDFGQLPGGVDRRVGTTDELFNIIPELVRSMQNEIAGGGTFGRTYNIGDIGPAGGIIFYDRGFAADGWRYLEAAPAGTDFTAEWGAQGRDVTGTYTAIGSGKQNTEFIVARLQLWGENYRAAQICVGIEINGYKDWFLPSMDELDLMYLNLHRRGLGGFSSTLYWSSSQKDNFEAWFKSFRSTGGLITHRGKVDTHSVRAVRAF